MKISRPLSALCVLLPTLAWSSPVHSVWSTSAIEVKDPTGWYNTSSANASLSWNQFTGFAFVNARATSTTGNVYEFQLVSTTASTTADAIVGTWNVTKNGIPLCTNCTGSAYGLTGGVGNYFKIYVNGETYGLIAYISSAYHY
ncbi:hypothetical protein F0U60_23235 [Archangium minus]|uniref:Uncharacterized protein n=1 Tax=Archangium minus TaxID=83450 RepID=A0ABY9WVP5_9BACT|nr:hypothetical protein F0U61_23330 [Archangium violaceum]WNG46702.1 hypothetical protein F0U60_23235 [Archangium minus]